MVGDAFGRADLFPLPCFDGYPLVGLPTGDEVRQKVRKTLKGACRALNWLAGHGMYAPNCSPTEQQYAVAARFVTSIVLLLDEDVDAPSDEVALSALLRGRRAYDGSFSATAIAPFREQAVSLPEFGTDDCQSLGDLLPESARKYLDKDFERMKADVV